MVSRRKGKGNEAERSEEENHSSILGSLGAEGFAGSVAADQRKRGRCRMLTSAAAEKEDRSGRADCQGAFPRPLRKSSRTAAHIRKR